MEIIRGSAKFLYGISDVKQLTQFLEQGKEHPIIGFGFVGRSNVGKSSMINSLFGKKTARVSNTPGRTREINIFSFQIGEKGKTDPDLPPFYLFDLPGYGHAEVSKKMAANWVVLMEEFFSKVPGSVGMVNLQDARHPNQKTDIEFHQFLKGFDFHTVLAFNKIDKLKKQKERAALQKLKPKLFDEYKWVKQIFFVSAEAKSGLGELEKALTSFLLQELEYFQNPPEDL